MSKPACITIGNFDGLHRGHQSLLDLAAAIAAREDLTFRIVTFWPHPREILTGKEAHTPLTTRAERLGLLKRTGAEVHELQFTSQLAGMSAEEFVNSQLLPLGLRWLVIGHDFSLGRRREGNGDLLRSLGEKYNFSMERAPAFEIDGSPVSSTRLRKLIAAGDVTQASHLLGRRYSISGIVTHGQGRGAGLGFPTANLDCMECLVPGDGVYATLAHYNGETHPAITNIGSNPTFEGKARTVESFLLSGGGNLYGKPFSLEFVGRLRGERKFDSPESLVSQIKTDIAEAKAVLKINDLQNL